MAPAVVYLFSLWLVSPVTISLVTPFALILTPLMIAVSRRHVLRGLGRVQFEFTLLALIAVLSVLSIANSNDPVRSIRIIYPCLVPMAIFANFVVVGYVSPGRLLAIPRLLIAACFLFSVGPFLVSFLVPPLKEFLFGNYRLMGFFKNPIQHAIGLAVVIPLVTVELALAKRPLHRIAWGVLLLLVGYTIFRTGSKSPMFFGFSSATVMYLALKIRSQSVPRNLVMLCAFVGTMIFLATFGLDLAEKLEPVVGSKIRSIVEGGLSNYQSIESRKLLWSEAIAQGKAHWIIGSGAGEKILGTEHAHNLVLDYFKGIGIFGALAIVLLCLSVFFRAGAKGLRILSGGADETDKRIWACYVGAAVYVLCNQMSDSFGPSTIGFLWTVYLAGILSERNRSSRETPL